MPRPWAPRVRWAPPPTWPLPISGSRIGARRRSRVPAQGRRSANVAWRTPFLSLVGNLERLARMDQIRILEDVSIGLEDALPLVRVAVKALGDFRQVVASRHRVGARRRRGRRVAGRRRRLRRRRRSSALDVGEVRLRLFVSHANLLSPCSVSPPSSALARGGVNRGYSRAGEPVSR